MGSQRELERKRALARQWDYSGPYGLEHTDTSASLQMFGVLGWVLAFMLGLVGLTNGLRWGLLCFALGAVPTVGCLLASAFVRNRARWRRQAASGHPIQSIGVVSLAMAMALWREVEAVDRAESAADRLALGREKPPPVVPTTTGGRTWPPRASTVLRTLEVLCWVATLATIVVCVGFGRVVGLNAMTVASFSGWGFILAAKVLKRQAIRAEAEEKRPTAAELACEDAALDAFEQEMAAEAAAEARLKREREPLPLRAVRLAELTDRDFPTTTLQ